MTTPSRFPSGRLSPPARAGFRRGLVAVAGLAVLAAAGTGSAATSAGTPVVKPTREVTTLLKSHTAFARPTSRSKSLEWVPARRPITEQRTVLPVLGHRTDRAGRRWLRVRLPGRPNGHTGWISRRSTVAARTPWHIVVSTSKRRVTVYRFGRVARVFKAVVGAPSTPTPHGNFFIEETIKMQPGTPGGPFALALSARSNVFQEFGGGPGQIGIHGLMNVGGTPGTAASHGCVRLDNGVMRWLVARIGPGAPVTIKS